jgi:glycosyltransferase involved in cell wall biosynthesis
MKKQLTQMIYQCTHKVPNGGLKTYLASLSNYQIDRMSDRVITSLENIEQSQCALLHVHLPEILEEITGECPVIYTVHGPGTFCPSLTQYLTARKSCCERKMSYLKCTWGHLVDNCGSRRPENVVRNLKRAFWEKDLINRLRIPLIAASQYMRGQLIKNGFATAQITTLHLGIPIPQTNTEPLTQDIHRQQRILFTGRLSPVKGLKWLLETLTQTDRCIHLDIAGDGYIRSKMERLSKELGLSDRVTWHGWCNQEQLDALYQQCFALIFPSVWPEPAGLVTLEAYAHYRPVIASSVGGIPEYISNGKTGILVPPHDRKSLAAAINELATNYQKARTIGEQGHSLLLEKFNLDFHVKGLQKIYERTIEDFETKN